MTISERLFKIMEDKNISMPELSRMTGISRHTIFDWQRRNTNPGADKIMIICGMYAGADIGTGRRLAGLPD